MTSEEKRTPFLGNRVIRDGSVTMAKLSEEVQSAIASGSGVEMVTQAEYNALTPDPNILYCITEDE